MFNKHLFVFTNTFISLCSYADKIGTADWCYELSRPGNPTWSSLRSLHLSSNFA